MEPMYPRAEIRQTDLGADVGAVGVAIAAGPGAGGRDPRHGREVPLVLRTLRPCHRGGAAWPLRRQAHHHRRRPATSDLTRKEAIAFDVASGLVDHGTRPELSNRQAVQAFGQHGAAELIYLVGLYCLVSVTLNGFDVPVPDPG